MTFKIGHTSFDCGPNIDSMIHRGSEVSFVVEIDPGTLVEAQAIRGQILGYLQAGVVPVTWSDDDTWDGFYYVTYAAVTPISEYLSTGFMNASLRLVQVPGFSSPTFELTTQWGARPSGTDDAQVPTGTHTVTPDPNITTPSWWDWLDANYTSAGSATSPAVQQHGVAVDTYYDYTALIEAQWPDGTWRPLTGLEFPRSIASGYTTNVHNAAGKFRLSNGLIRVYWDFDGDEGNVAMEAYDTVGDQWQTAGGKALDWFDMRDSSNGGFILRGQPKILRNDIDVVKISFPCGTENLPSTTAQAVRFVMSLDRFDNFCVLSSLSEADDFTIRTRGGTVTEHEGGFSAAANAGTPAYDLVVAGSGVNTNGAVNRSVRDFGREHPLALGLSPNPESGVIEPFWAAKSAHTRVVLA